MITKTRCQIDLWAKNKINSFSIYRVLNCEKQKDICRVNFINEQLFISSAEYNFRRDHGHTNESPRFEHVTRRLRVRPRLGVHQTIFYLRQLYKTIANSSYNFQLYKNKIHNNKNNKNINWFLSTPIVVMENYLFAIRRSEQISILFSSPPPIVSLDQSSNCKFLNNFKRTCACIIRIIDTQ